MDGCIIKMIKNNKGETKKLLIVLGVVTLLFGLVFGLINFGYIEFIGDPEQDFISTNVDSFSGYNPKLEIKNFRFCYDAQAKEGCEEEVNSFFPGEEVFFFFEVKAETLNGSLQLIENYKLIDYNGAVLINNDQEYDKFYEMESNNSEELVYYYDSIKLTEEQELGNYSIELFIENGLTGDKATTKKSFEVFDLFEEPFFEEGFDESFYYDEEE